MSQEPVRIFLANRPRMIRQMLRRAIQHVPDLQVVGESTRLQSVLNVPQLMSIDWLVVSLNDKGEIPIAYQRFVEAYPTIRILGMSIDGNELAINEPATGKRRTLRNVSLKALMALFQDKQIKETFAS